MLDWVKRKIQEIQNRPYEARFKILRNTVILIALILILIWVLTLKTRTQTENGDSNRFAPIFENLKNIYEKR